MEDCNKCRFHDDCRKSKRLAGITSVENYCPLIDAIDEMCRKLYQSIHENDADEVLYEGSPHGSDE
jgi:hypothetical protein